MEVPHKVMKTTLERELELYKRFLEACRALRQCVKESDSEALRKCVKTQEDVAAAIGDLEGARQLLVQEFAERYELAPADVTLRMIAREAGPQAEQELLDLQAALKSITAEVQQENHVNSMLLGESLQYIQGTFEILAGVNRKRDTYNAGGKKPTRIRTERNILNRVA
jgi:flagellar biosynthesis/type III secretory pathway chaperone